MLITLKQFFPILQILFRAYKKIVLFEFAQCLQIHYIIIPYQFRPEEHVTYFCYVCENIHCWNFFAFICNLFVHIPFVRLMLQTFATSRCFGLMFFFGGDSLQNPFYIQMIYVWANTLLTLLTFWEFSTIPYGNLAVIKLDKWII